MDNKFSNVAYIINSYTIMYGMSLIAYLVENNIFRDIWLAAAYVDKCIELKLINFAKDSTYVVLTMRGIDFLLDIDPPQRIELLKTWKAYE